MEIKKQSDVIKPLNMKEVFEVDNNRTEEGGMSPFIAQNIDQISKITGYDLEVVDREVFVGDFRADIVCKDINTNEVVIIENQIDKSDHEHLGKAFVYFSNLGAKAIVWICDSVREEHKKAVETFNELTPEDYNFFMLELKFNKYDKNTALYEFNKIVIPDSINKLANEIKNTKSSGFITANDFLNKFVTIINKKIPKAKYDNRHRYMFICSNSFGWLQIQVNKDLHIVFEFGYDLSRNKDSNYDCDKILNDTLLSLYSQHNYNFKYEVGSKNENYHRIKYVTDLTIADFDEIEKMTINIYNIVYNLL